MLKIVQQSRIINNFTFKSAFKNSQRIRNYFEVNPIYPDFQDQDGVLFRDETKQKYLSNNDKLQKIKKGHMKQMYGKARQYVKKQQERERKLKDLKEEKGSNTLTVSDRVNQLAQSILVDQESQLIFGFGFDEFIQNLKEKKTKDAEGEYLQILQQILYKLKIKNDTELIQLYKYVIAEETKDSYRNEARKIIIKRVLLEVQAIKQSGNSNNTQVLDKYLDFSKSSKEFVMDSFNDDLESNQLLEEKLESQLNASEVDTVAQNLALNKLEQKIEVNKEQESQNYQQNKVFSSDFSDDADIFELNKSQTEFNKKMGLSDNIDAQNFEDFKVESIYREIKGNFKRNKQQYEDELQEAISQEKNTEEFFSFLQQGQTEQEIDSYLRKYQMVDELQQKPEFSSVLENIDFLIDSAPVSLKSQLNNNSKEFSGSFAETDIDEQDMLWHNFGNNFLKIFPTGQLPSHYNQISEQSAIEGDICAQDEKKTIYEYEGQVEEQENIRNHIYSEKDLEEDERIELEVYRRIKTDPFFTHYIQNDLKYFSERMLDGYQDAMKNMTLYDKAGDVMNYNEANLNSEKNIEILDQDEPEVQSKRKQQIENEIKERIYASGKRKKSHCQVTMTKGSGKVTINNKPYLEYFPHPIQRNACMKGIYLSGLSCQYDVNIHVRGGGLNGQTHAISNAVCRAVVQIIPGLRPEFIKLNLLQTDPRKKERKKTGQYKARKAWTYVRR